MTYVSMKIDLNMTPGLAKILKGSPRGEGAYAMTTRVANRVVEEIRKGGKGVSYGQPTGGAPVSKPGKKNYLIGSKGGVTNQFPRGYLSQNHYIGGRKSNNVTIVSRAPYTHSIINGGVTPTGGIYPGNNYPHRVLKKINANLANENFYKRELRTFFGIVGFQGYEPGTFLGDKGPNPKY